MSFFQRFIGLISLFSVIISTVKWVKLSMETEKCFCKKRLLLSWKTKSSVETNQKPLSVLPQAVDKNSCSYDVTIRLHCQKLETKQKTRSAFSKQ